MQMKLTIFLICMHVQVRGLQRKHMREGEKSDFNLCNCNIHGNLGGIGGLDVGDLGPGDVDASGEMKKELRYKSVSTLATGEVLDLVITNTSEYFPNPENPLQAAESGDTTIGGEWLNGRKDCIGRINFRAPGDVSLKFSFVLSGTDTVAPPTSWDFTILDFDQSRQGMYESFTVQGIDSWYSTGAQPIIEGSGEAYTFGSADDNVQVPNPTSVYNLNDDQIDSSVGMVFRDKSEWEMIFKATDSGEDNSGGRNLFFAGRTLLQDLGDEDPTVAPTPAPTDVPTPVPVAAPTPVPFFDPTPVPTEPPTTETTTECPPDMWMSTTGAGGGGGGGGDGSMTTGTTTECPPDMIMSTTDFFGGGGAGGAGGAGGGGGGGGTDAQNGGGTSGGGGGDGSMTTGTTTECPPEMMVMSTTGGTNTHGDDATSGSNTNHNDGTSSASGSNSHNNDGTSSASGSNAKNDSGTSSASGSNAKNDSGASSASGSKTKNDDGTCVIYADPHIDTFDNPNNGPFLSRIAYFDSEKPSLSLITGVADNSKWGTTGPTIDVNEYERGDFWLVKNDAIHIQGRYNVSVEFGGKRSGLAALAVGGPLLGGGTLIVEPKFGGVTLFGNKLLKKGNYSERTPAGLVRVNTFFNAYSEGNVSPNGVNVTLPSKVHMQIRQYNTHIDAKIRIPKSLGKTDGQCGNFNGDPLDDTLDQIQKRMVDMKVKKRELLFASPYWSTE